MYVQQVDRGKRGFHGWDWWIDFKTDALLMAGESRAIVARVDVHAFHGQVIELVSGVACERVTIASLRTADIENIVGGGGGPPVGSLHGYGIHLPTLKRD